MIFLQFSQNKEERYHLSSWACSRNNVLSFLGNVRMCVSKGSNLFCVRKAKSVLVWGKPSFFYKRKSLEITVVKEGDRGELRKSKKGSIQSFLAASVSEASELSLSQIILFFMKTFCVAFSVVKLVLLAMCSCCLSQLHDPPGRSCAGYFFMLKRESFKHKQGEKKKSAVICWGKSLLSWSFWECGEVLSYFSLYCAHVTVI